MTKIITVLMYIFLKRTHKGNKRDTNKTAKYFCDFAKKLSELTKRNNKNNTAIILFIYASTGTKSLWAY